MLYSSSMVLTDKHTHSPVGARMMVMQLVWSVIGAVACVILAASDYGRLRKLVWPMFGVTLVLAALVFVPHVGISINGARRWIRLPFSTLQPSEFVKLGLIFAIAWYAEKSQRKMRLFTRGVLVPCAVIGAAVGLIFIEPDRGTTALLGAVTFTMLWIAGSRWWQLGLVVLVGVALLVFSIIHDPMRMNRIMAWRNPEAHLTGAALQGKEAEKAIGAGGLTGVGLGNGLQKNGFVPEIQSDFIFANIGEELGLVGTMGVVTGFFLIAMAGIRIARQARDQFGCLLAVGITALISYQAIFNMCVVTGLIPNKGIALPFISAGGSSLVAMLIGVGILFSIARHAGPLRVTTPESMPDENPFAARA